MKRTDVLKKREMHRGDPQGLVFNLLINYSWPARLMHSFLPPVKGKEDILQAAMRAYVIGIAACVETFFRDLFFYLLKRNPHLLQKALKETNRRESTSRLPQYLAEGVSAEEFVASASFQSVKDINRNISIFFPSPLFEMLDGFELLCSIPSTREKGTAQLKLSSSWQDDLDKLFSLRHEFAHDANTKTQVSTAEMQRIETSVLVMCQMTILLPGIAPQIIIDDCQLPAILLVADLTSEDWELAQ